MKFNIPLTGEYNTRMSSSNTLTSSSGIVGIGIVGVMVVGRGSSSSDKDERYFNCFLTKQGAKKYVIKRPGHSTLNTPQAGSIGNRIMIWAGQSNKIISAFGATNSSIYDGTTRLTTDNGDTTIITGLATGITETSISSTPTLAITSSDNTAWYYQNAGTVTKITDAQYPGNNSLTVVGTFAHMNGFAYVMDSNGFIWNSDLNSVTSWLATSFVSANSYPDKGIGVVRYKNVIMAFGTESIQFFYQQEPVPAVGSPLTRSESATVRIGAIGADAIATVSDRVFWVGSTPQGGLTVYQYDGAVQRISHPEQDFQLSVAGPGNISVATFKLYGRSFVKVQAGSVAWGYLIEDGHWFEITSSVPMFQYAGASAGSQVLTYGISKISTSGKVYVVDPSSLVFTDDGMSYGATIQTMADDGGTRNRKFWNSLSIICDQESSGNLAVSVSDDDFQTYQTLGTVDLSKDVPKMTRLGASRKRAWKFSHSDNASFRIERFECDVTPGVH